MNRFGYWKPIVAILCAILIAASTSRAQTLTTIHSFGGTDGSFPNALVQATDGNFYGTTANSGAHGYGTVFQLTPGGVLTTLYNFCSEPNCTDGYFIDWGTGLVQAADGGLYGTTNEGGTNGGGTAYRITTGGALTTVYQFCSEPNCADGSFPNALVQASDRNLYGTTANGGANGYGTVFQLTPGGVLTTLYNFCSEPNCTDGASPFDALIQAKTDGYLYGTTFENGVLGGGTVFKISTAGEFSVLSPVGGNPTGSLVQASDGNFYGTTERR